MTAPEERNPLARALDELAAGARYTVPVEQVRAGVRRRRARRTGAVSAVAVVAVATIAGGAYLGLPGRGDSPTGAVPGPWPSTRQDTAVDWPAQFLRCGRRAADALPDVGGPMTVALADAPSSIAADERWEASVTADVPTARGDSAVVWGTDLSVVRDGVVVGVQEGPTTPDLSLSLRDRLGDEGRPANPLPLTTAVTGTLVSCGQYPNGGGSPVLAPGTYQLVVTQTLSYASAPGVDAALTDVRSSVVSTLTITAPVDGTSSAPASAAAQPQLARCGRAVDQLLPDLGELALSVDETTDEVPSDGTWLGRLSGALPALPDAQGWLWGTDLTLTRGGVVVGVQATGGAPDDLAGVAARTHFASSPFPQVSYGSSGFLGCDTAGGPIEPGTYGLVVTETVAAERPDGTRLDARASTRTSVTITEPQHAEAAAATACGASDAELRRLADPQRNPAPVTISADVPATIGAAAGGPQPEITVRYAGADHALASSGAPTVVLTRDGVVAGGIGAGGWGVGPAAWVTVGGGGPYRSCSSFDAGTDVRLLDLRAASLPAGDYELWAVTTAHLSTPAAHDVQVAAGPWRVTLTDAG